MIQLIRLEPSQVATYWPLIKVALDGGLASLDRSPQRDSNVQQKLMTGAMQAWTLTDIEANKICAIATSMIYTDNVTNDQVFYVYSLYSLPDSGMVDMQDWVRVFDGAKAWAISQGCTKVIAYTNEPRIKEMFTASGSVAEFSMMVQSLKQEDLSNVEHAQTM